MLSPNYLSETDRNRLVEINQLLLTVQTSEEATELRAEQQSIMAQSKNIQECTFDELQDLRQQLFNQYQKHAAIGSKQTLVIARYIQQVEMREMLIASKRVDEPEKTEHETPDKARSGRVLPKPSEYSWTPSTIDDD